MCRECISSPGPRLPFSGAGDHKLFPKGHFVLPDTNVFLSQVCYLSRRDLLALILLVDGPHGVKLFHHAYYSTADSAGGSSAPVASTF
jgi:hypothetical protein